MIEVKKVETEEFENLLEGFIDEVGDSVTWSIQGCEENMRITV